MTVWAVNPKIYRAGWLAGGAGNSQGPSSEAFWRQSSLFLGGGQVFFSFPS